MLRRVILDTNFLLVPAREDVDIFSELERACPSGVRFAMMEGSRIELELLAARGGKERAQVKLANTVIRAKKVEQILHQVQSVDDAIVDEAQRGDIVATMDLKLRRRLKEKGVDVAVLRSRNHVEIIVS